jgi:hypothetical protein
MEVTPLHGIFLRLPIVLIFLWIRLVFLRFSIFSLPFFLWVGDSLALLLLRGVPRPKFSHLLFKILLNFDNISIGRAQGQDIQKLHLCLDVSMCIKTGSWSNKIKQMQK